MHCTWLCFDALAYTVETKIRVLLLVVVTIIVIIRGDFPGSKPTIKQKLAAVRMLYDFLVVKQITPTNPESEVSAWD
jgi:site-specific recombinase XerD